MDIAIGYRFESFLAGYLKQNYYILAGGLICECMEECTLDGSAQCVVVIIFNLSLKLTNQKQP